MRKKNIIAFIMGVMIVGGLFWRLGLDYVVRAEYPGKNLTGWAWNGLYGWISFNSYDLDLAPPDGKIDVAIDGLGTKDNNDFGVKIDNGSNFGVGDYSFSGDAWSSGLGWISFSKTGALPASLGANKCDFASHCKKANLTTVVDCDTGTVTACYDIEDGKVYGWAHILALGDDGWIRLDEDQSGGADYEGVTIDWSGGAKPFLKGWAYNQGTGNTGMGWISFNSLDLASCDTNGDNLYSDADNVVSDYCPRPPHASAVAKTFYKVEADINLKPEVYGQVVTTPTACSGSSILNSYKLRFGYKDDSALSGASRASLSASKYRIRISGGDINYDSTPCDVAAPGANCGTITGNCLSDSRLALAPNTCEFTPPAGVLGYNKNGANAYSIEITDSNGVVSDTVTTGSFTIANGEPPIASINLSNSNPSLNEQVVLTSTSQYFVGGVPQNCPLVGTCTYAWSFKDKNGNTVTGDNGTPANPNDDWFTVDTGALNSRQLTITVKNTDLKTIGLDVTTVGSCPDSEAFANINAALPGWAETGSDE